MVLLRLVGRIGKGAVFDEDMRAEVLKDMKSESAADSATNGIVKPFNDSTGETFVEVVQELVPLMLQSLGELYQLR